jgi:primosomal protein N' (replication factor Y) (superfamily II helicase)
MQPGSQPPGSVPTSLHPQSMLLASVAVPVPLGQPLTYRLPPELAAKCRRGMRVLCPLGRRTVIGVVLAIEDAEPNIPLDKLKPLGALIDAEPALPEELLDFLIELSRYYLAPIGEVLRLALPAVERSSETTEGLFAAKAKVVGRLMQRVHWVQPSPSEAATTKGKATEILQALAGGPLLMRDLEQQFKSARAVVKRLAAQGLLRIETVTQMSDPFFADAVPRDAPPELTAAQRAAVDGINAAIDAGQRKAFLLHGVTASGKTEVYLHVVQRCLQTGRGALVLVPEIALTPQLVGRFRARLGDAIAVIHSAIGDGERHQMWKRLRSGEVRVAVGARSALFAPVMNLGLICVDEEHDTSFKQEEGVRYHARDMALWRAHRAGGQCVLGSATPSLTSMALADRSVLEKYVLPARARAASALPAVEIVDLCRNKAGPTGDRLLTWPLVRAIEQVLDAKEQAILFLNRRGFAPSLLCDNCGTILRCPDCSIALTVHRRGKPHVVCHLCDYRAPLPERCPECKGSELSEEGAGTERIEMALAQRFGQARIARLDRDVAGGAKSEAVLDRMRRREIDILVGTQMVTKGHDLPDVTLVGVLDADAALSMPDYRAAERAFQLLVQVAGRAGRGERPGHVVVQTRQPDSSIIACALKHDVSAFVAYETAQRQQLGYPPFARLALVRFEGLDDALVTREAQRVAQQLLKASIPAVRLSGPAPAPITRIRNRWRHRFLLKSADRQKLRDALLVVSRTPVDRRVRVIIDVDPVNML